MSNHSGYKGKSLEFLEKHNLQVGNIVSIETDYTYSGILMPRYEYNDDKHIVLKLKSGYNIGLKIDKIKKIEIESSGNIKKENMVQQNDDPKLPKIILV